MRSLRPSAAALTILATLAAGAASAQAPAPPAGAQLTNPGPALPGVCIMDSNRVIQTSAVGRAVAARLQQLGQQVRAELQPQQTAIETEARTLDTQRATLQPAQLQQRGGALQTRYATFQQLAEIRGRELQATEQVAIRRVGTEMQPVVNQVYGQRGCGLLLDRNSVIAANPAMDISDAVIQGLNARIQTFTFERERAPAQGAAPAAGAARPATPPTTPPRR